MLLESLKSNAVERGLLQPEEEIGLEKAFLLVRDMPYTRASSRNPNVIMQEWRGTCSGQHYLLKGRFSELGYNSRLIACTTVVHIDPKDVSGKVRTLLEQSNGRFADVHNYLVLELPEKEMIVDATWPLATKGMGTVVNERFRLGEDHQIACTPVKTWVVPEDGDHFQNPIRISNITLGKSLTAMVSSQYGSQGRQLMAHLENISPILFCPSLHPGWRMELTQHRPCNAA